MSQSFYDQLWELLETEFGDTVLCDQMADRIYDLVKEYYTVPAEDVLKIMKDFMDS